MSEPSYHHTQKAPCSENRFGTMTLLASKSATRRSAVGQFVDGFLTYLDEQKKGSEHG